MLAELTILAGALSLTPPQLAENPGSSQQEGSREGAVAYTVFVDPKGRAMDCSVDAVIGDNFAAQVCGDLMRARFEPARGPDGKATYGAFHSIANFWRATAGKDSAYPVRLKPELSVMVKPAPGLTGPRDVPVAVLIDGQGAVADCAAVTANTPAGLLSTACAQLKSQWVDTALEDPQGSERYYVRQVTVSFEPETAAR